METDYAGGILANQLIRMPTKKYDGGMNAQDRQLLHQMEVDVWDQLLLLHPPLRRQ